MNTHPGESTQAVPLCDVEFVDGRRCSKTAGHWTPESQDLHVPAEPAPPADSHQATCGEPRPTDHVQASADKPRGPLSGGGK